MMGFPSGLARESIPSANLLIYQSYHIIAYNFMYTTIIFLDSYISLMIFKIEFCIFNNDIIADSTETISSLYKNLRFRR